uniref:Alpha-1,4-N-acetylglucosaminyltransferase n=1 Tax=Magallana gigas TaxID=29159 RepID=A0A8W8KE60_MAGGI
MNYRAAFTVCFLIIQLGILVYVTLLFYPNYEKGSRICFKKEDDEAQRLKYRLHGMQKLLKLVYRKAKVVNSREESCDIETAVLFLKKNNVSKTVFKNTFEDFSPLGGRDWSFKTYIPCSNKSLEVNGTSKELIRSQFIPSCVNYDVKLEVRKNLNESLKFPVSVNPPSKIGNRKIVFLEHKSDILRLQILREYGGIYLDTDQLLLTSLDKFRDRECTMGVASDGYLGSAVIIASKNSAFIKKWMDSYSAYKPNSWGQNSVIMATKLAKQNPNLIHLERHYCSFYPYPTYLFKQNYKWSHSYGLHIYKPGREKQLKQLNFSSIRKLNNTLGAAFRFVLFDDKELCL